MDLLLKAESVTKRFPHVVANDSISMNIRKGEIHCLLGENGAGKTTLAEILYGYYQPSSGRLLFNGREARFASPNDAIACGIGMVHQHFVLVPPLTVVENVVVGAPSNEFLLDLDGAAVKLNELCQAYGVAIDVKRPVWQLSVGEQQWVEILKALYVGVKLLILDEPTAVLTPHEIERFFAILNKMRQEGVSILFITHKLNEVAAISDRVTVLRKGRHIATVNTAEVTREELAYLMVGRDVKFRSHKEAVPVGEPVLAIENLRVENDFQRELVRGVNLSIHGGEILALAGVAGNGQRELFDALVGVRKAIAGKILLENQDISRFPPDGRMRRGLASIPEDRLSEGLVSDLPIHENMVLGFQWDARFAWRGMLLNRGSIRKFTREAISAFDIAAPSPDTTTRVLSGGNLQKILLARELAQSPRCLIVCQPTRGLDVGATEYVHSRILQQRQAGTGILLISEDLDEIFNLADRIAVIFKGEIMGVLRAEEATRESVGLLMAGVTEARL